MMALLAAGPRLASVSAQSALIGVQFNRQLPPFEIGASSGRSKRLLTALTAHSVCAQGEIPPPRLAGASVCPAGAYAGGHCDSESKVARANLLHEACTAPAPRSSHIDPMGLSQVLASDSVFDPYPTVSSLKASQSHTEHAFHHACICHSRRNDITLLSLIPLSHIICHAI